MVDFGDQDPLNPKHDHHLCYVDMMKSMGNWRCFFKFIFGRGIDKYFHGIYGLFKEAWKKKPVLLFKQYDLWMWKRFLFQCSGDVLNVCFSLGWDWNNLTHQSETSKISMDGELVFPNHNVNFKRCSFLVVRIPDEVSLSKAIRRGCTLYIQKELGLILR